MARPNLDYIAVLEELRAQLQGLGFSAFVGELPPRDGVALATVGGTAKYDFQGNGRVTMQVAVTGKAKVQADALQLCQEALTALQRMTTEGYYWKLTGTTARGVPVYAGQDAGGAFMYSAQLDARVAFWAKEVG